ncbi:ATP-binding cassette subfamily G member 4-like [Daktulosphaira vitifoliae]|uniref:ATP-binding cassette subfamily G member 4-like n=1 Tax=Daktulosphaira vitifoliae TaxID=58002 RepID=UPI0021AAABD7|nr:ATP-binding cassette subfamily G member 4-like [Daktulosphaira vitifoliae]
MTVLTSDDKTPMNRVKSTVSFAAMLEETMNINDGDHSEEEVCELIPEESPGRTRVFSMSKDRPITRIPTRVEMKTLTHKAKRPAVDIEFHDLIYTVDTTAGERTILKSVNGFFRSGHLTAIMGPSGAGKSSIMNILAGYVRSDIKGQILTNGHPRNMQLFKKLSSYIMQDDLLQPRLTVLESLTYAARLKIGNELSKEDKCKAVDEVIELLGVTKCQNTFVEKLSGGQRKRLSIALELVNNPPVIFLDEPTTGLDYFAIKQCMSLLVDLAKQGRTVICTIHQPTSSQFHMFDHVYMLARGSCIYNGTPRQLVPFLAQVGHVCKSTYNPADFVFEVLDNDTIKNLNREIQNGKIILCDEINESEKKPPVAKLCRNETLAVLPRVFDNLESSNKKYPGHSSSFLTQFSIILDRKTKQILRNSTALYISFFHHLISALLLGSINLGIGIDGDKPFENFKFCISIVVFFIYTYCMVPILTFPGEVKLIRREYFNHWYGLKSYCLATYVTSIPPLIIFGGLFCLVAYFMSAQPLDWIRLTQFMVSGLFTGYISEGLGILIGSAVNSATGAVLTPALVAPLLAVAVYGMGFGQVIEPFMKTLMGLSFVRYSLVATIISLYGNGRAEMECHSPDLYCHYKNPELLMKDLGMNGESMTRQFILLALFGFTFRLGVYYVIKIKMTNKALRDLPLFFKKLVHR